MAPKGWCQTVGWALLLVLVAFATSATAQEVKAAWIPPHASAGGGPRPVVRPPTGTNSNKCTAAGSGCTSCTYRRPTTRGLLGSDPAAAAGGPAATVQGTWRPPFASGGGSSSSGSGSSDGGWTSSSSGGSNGGSSSSSGGGSGGSGGSIGSATGRWSCTSCASSKNFELTTYKGYGTCGCTERYGAQSTGPKSTAWSRYPAWPTSFQCQSCPDGFVPLGPESNLQVAFDSSSSTWSLKIASKVAGAKAHVRSAQARAASTGGVSTAAAKPSSPVLSARAQNAVAARTKKVVAASTCDGGCGDAPWYPYECVPCPTGYSVDFYGLTCEADVCTDDTICGEWGSSTSSSSGGSSSGGSTTSSSSSSSGSTTSSSSSSSGGSTTSSSSGSSSGSTSGGGGGGNPCITCNPTNLEALAKATCTATPDGIFLLGDECMGPEVPTITSNPSVLLEEGLDAVDCTKLRQLPPGSPVTFTLTVSASAATTCDAVATYAIAVPTWSR